MSNTIAYPAIFHSEPEGGYSITFPDFPEAHTQGDDEQDALAMASDCLRAVIEWRLEDQAAIPAPSVLRRGQRSIPVPLDLAPKVALIQEMRSQRVNKVALARRMGVSEVIVRRLLDPKHVSRPKQYESALSQLGVSTGIYVVSRKANVKTSKVPIKPPAKRKRSPVVTA